MSGTAEKDVMNSMTNDTWISNDRLKNKTQMEDEELMANI
jgi:hypothetical protein